MFQMNPQRGRHMSGGEGGGQNQGQGPKHPDIHIKSHSNGHTVHIMHQDGHHTKSEHEHGDAEGIKAKIDEHIGGGQPSADAMNEGEPFDADGGQPV